MQDLVIKVGGMSCGHCKASVTKALLGLDGVQSVDVDLASGNVQVRYDAAKQTVGSLQNVILDAGYEIKD